MLAGDEPQIEVHANCEKGERGAFLKPYRMSGATSTECREEDMETTKCREEDMETITVPMCLVGMSLGDDSDTLTINVIPEGAQGGRAEQTTHEEAIDDLPVKRKRNKRSLIWRYYEQMDSSPAARCVICSKLQSLQGGSTSNLHRHMSNRHPDVFSQLTADMQNPAPFHSSQSPNANVEVTLEDEDSDILKSAVNTILDCALEGPVKQITHEKASDEHLVKRKGNKRSLIWKHFEQLNSLDAARCHICKKKLHYFEGGSTSNLHRHMSKRHPEVFSQHTEEGPLPLPPKSSQSLNASDDTSTTPETEMQRQFSGLFNHPRAFGRGRRAFCREIELIEAIRRAQREEAQALEIQRELLEKLRAFNIREATAEREQIESMRKALVEEARDLSRQKIEMQIEKTELQKKLDAFQKERELDS